MSHADEFHQNTDAIYRNLAENFTPGLRHLISCSRVYHKTLSGVTGAARAYIDALAKLGHSCKTTCKGGTQVIGEAIFQIADAYRQIQIQIEEANKSFVADFITPLENKLETQFKDVVSSQKRYIQGHKSVYGLFDKAENTLKKVRKKSKNKPIHDEREHMGRLTEAQEKLVVYRTNGYKLALLEEHKDYSYLLEKCTAMVKIHATRHSKAGLFLTQQLPVYNRLIAEPHVLPSESVALLKQEFHSNGQGPVRMHLTAPSNMSSPFHQPRPSSVPPGMDYQRQFSAQSAPEQFIDSSVRQTMVKSLPRTISVPPASLHNTQVRAAYSHHAEGDNQLSFTEGDLITLIGDKAGGWHYGYNTVTHGCGWFPLSFTETYDPSHPGSVPTRGNIAEHFRSLADLQDDLSDQNSIDPETQMVQRRPRSMYETSTNQQTVEWVNYVGSLRRGETGTGGQGFSPYSSPRHQPVYSHAQPIVYRAPQIFPKTSLSTTLVESDTPFVHNQHHHYATAVINGVKMPPPAPPLPGDRMYSSSEFRSSLSSRFPAQPPADYTETNKSGPGSFSSDSHSHPSVDGGRSTPKNTKM